MNTITQIIEEINKINPKFKTLLTLNQKQTADAIGVSGSTLEAWRKQGLGPQFKKINSGTKGRVLYPKISIAEWISETTATA